MSFSIEWINNNAKINMRGDITLHDVLDITLIINSDDRFSNMEYRLYDLSEVNSFLSCNKLMDHLVEINETSSSWNRNLKIAIVSKDQNTREIVKEFTKKIVYINWQVKLFSSVKIALQWCNE